MYWGSIFPVDLRPTCIKYVYSLTLKILIMPDSKVQDYLSC